MNGKLAIDTASYRQLMSNLAELPRRVGLRVFRVALNAWGGTVRNFAKVKARRETGLLQKSLKVKVAIPDASYNVKHHGKPAYVIVGPARGVEGLVQNGRTVTRAKLEKTGWRGNRVTKRRPSRYAHLVERRYPFIGPAQEHGKTAGMAVFADKLGQGIDKEAAALPKQRN